MCCRCFRLQTVPMLRCIICRAPMLKWTICCRCLVSKLCPIAELNDLLPLLWSRSGAPMSEKSICCVDLVMKSCPIAKMNDLLPFLWSRSFASVPRCTMYCRCFGLEMVPQCQDARFVAVGLVSKWCRNVKTYDLL